MASEQSRKATSPTMLNRTEHSFARSLDGAGRSPDRHEHNSMTGKGKGHDRNGKSLKGWRRSCERPISNQRQDDSPPTHSSSLLWLPTLPLQLPTELMHQVLLHADGTTLSAAQVVSKALHALITIEHWRVASTRSRWLQRPTPDPDSFKSVKEATAYWRQWSRVAAERVEKGVSGRLVLCGGTGHAATIPTDEVRAISNESWEHGLTLGQMPRMMTRRSTAAVAVNRYGRLFVLGGRGTATALSTCESLACPAEAFATTSASITLNFSSTATRLGTDGPPRVTGSLRQRAGKTASYDGGESGSEYGAYDEAVSWRGNQGEGKGIAEAEEISASTTKGQGESEDNGDGQYEEEQEEQAISRRNEASSLRGAAAQGGEGAAGLGWNALPSMRQGRCFLGAAFEPHGGLLAIGGGTGPFRHHSPFETVEILRSCANEWVEGPSMSHARCGLGVTATPDGKIYAVGGYGGNYLYLDSAEVFDAHCERWTNVAPMRRRRTGLGLAAGPKGRLYSVGGSANGSSGHAFMECFDPREGIWTPGPPMVFGRAFCCAAFGGTEFLYVMGGSTATMGTLRTIEMFDPRSERWRVVDRFADTRDVAITDACLVFQP